MSPAGRNADDSVGLTLSHWAWLSKLCQQPLALTRSVVTVSVGVSQAQGGLSAEPDSVSARPPPHACPVPGGLRAALPSGSLHSALTTGAADWATDWAWQGSLVRDFVSTGTGGIGHATAEPCA
jgi:hypothetical protein